MIEKNKIAERIKALRCQFKYSQQHVADRLFISQAAYSHLENGKNCIGIDHIIRLSQIYRRTTDFLILGEESKKD